MYKQIRDLSVLKKVSILKLNLGRVFYSRRKGAGGGNENNLIRNVRGREDMIDQIGIRY